MRHRLFYILLLCHFATLHSFAQKADAYDNAELLHRCERALTAVIVHDIFSPPVASRIYLYANIAAYEAIVPFQDEYKSLSVSLSSFPSVNFNGDKKNINPNLAAVYAFMKTAQRFVFSEKMLEDSLNVILKYYKKTSPAVYKKSVAFAQIVSDSIFRWANKDNYRETRKIRRYNYLKQDGKWMPTPPGYIAAVEPYWNRIRTIALDSAGQFKPEPPPVFSKEKESGFYKQAYEVYNTGVSLSIAQRDIALFWDCNPFFLNTQGHLNFATKKLSPGGHWISITGIAASKIKAPIMKAAAAYVLTSVALFDGFISCWDEKYRSNLIRPETYINSYIDEKWRPLLQTPPFPEYTSGHSVISTAAAIVLTDFFGNNFAFNDDTETPYGLPIRHFNSFLHAAEEAAISRHYGGIHYMAAIENGQIEGMLIGKKVIEKFNLRK